MKSATIQKGGKGRSLYISESGTFYIADGYKIYASHDHGRSWRLRTLSKDLIKNGITIKQPLNGVNVELLHSQELVDYLNSRNHSAYPYYFVPRKKDVRSKNEVID